MTQKISLNHAWEFTERFDDVFLRGGTAEGLRTVELPHTCRETPYDYFDESLYQMDCGYRRLLTVPKEWAGKRVFLCVGAAGHRSEVYLDGKKLYEHRCGYTAFRVELTEGLSPGGTALLAIRVDSRESLDQPPFGYVIDYMTYGGLYREVWLEVREQTCLEDVFAKPIVPGWVSALSDRTAARFDGRLDCGLSISGTGLTAIRQRVYTAEGDKPLAERTFQAETRETSLTVPGAALWDVDAPRLYTLVTELLDGERVLDRAETRFGFRAAEFRADGFRLNGRKLKLVGLNRHQSWPYVGYAMPKSMQRQDADILKKELGCNAVRTSHYPQSQHFIDRCDELGLLVFTEIPGWQHVGGDEWKEQAVRNTEDMVRQYRNHPSVILWGVRINESRDDDALYARTNAAARRLDPTRPTGGVRYLKKSSLLEDVYTYNDFSHDGTNRGCEKKKDITPDMGKAYLISEYNGHMFPTKAFDSEEHRLEHALRHARVLDAIAGEEDVAGGFGWCMFDYNTHRDFGSGDRICYHGVTDMFRNKKPAAEVYAAQQDETPVLAVSSAFDIGEHPASNRGRVFVFTNAEEVRMYKDGTYIRSYTHADSPFRNMKNPPIEIDDFIGDQIEKGERFAPLQARYVKDLLNYAARFGMNHLPPELMAKAGVLMTRYRMSFDDAYALYGKYVSNWGSSAMEFRFDALIDGRVVASALRRPCTKRVLRAKVSHTVLREGDTYDAASVRLALTDQDGGVLSFAQEPVTLETEGPLAIVGPATAMLRGGLGGTYVKTVGTTGAAALTLACEGAEPVRIEFIIKGEG